MTRLITIVSLAAFQTLLSFSAVAQSQEARAARMAQEETERAQRQAAENAKKVKMQLIVESDTKTNANTRNAPDAVVNK